MSSSCEPRIRADPLVCASASFVFVSMVVVVDESSVTADAKNKLLLSDAKDVVIGLYALGCGAVKAWTALSLANKATRVHGSIAKLMRRLALVLGFIVRALQYLEKINDALFII